MKRGLSVCDLSSETSESAADHTEDLGFGSGVGVTNSQQRLKRTRKGGATPQQLDAVNESIDRVISQVCHSPIKSPDGTKQLTDRINPSSHATKSSSNASGSVEFCLDSLTNESSSSQHVTVAELLHLHKTQQQTIMTLQCKVTQLSEQLTRISQFLGISADAVDAIGTVHGDKLLTDKAVPSEHHKSVVNQPEPKDTSGPTAEKPPPSQAEPTSQSVVSKNHKSLQELVLNTIYRNCKV